MMISRSYCSVSAVIVAAVALSGCSSSTIPSSTAGALGAASRVGPTAGKNLLYVTGACGGTCILSYPKGKHVSALSVAGASLCSDRSGNVFVPTSTSSGQAVVYEFAHGGTQPIATLNLSGILAEGCTVDPKSGDLAVTYLCSGCNYGPVAVFHNAKGTPKVYSQSGVFLSYCGYDGKSNLFADGNGANGFALLELPSGGSALGPIAVSQSISTSGAVQRRRAIRSRSRPLAASSRSERKACVSINGSASTTRGLSTRPRLDFPTRGAASCILAIP